MLKNNTYNESAKEAINGNYKKEMLELCGDIFCLTTLRHYNPQMGNLNLAMKEINLYKVVREKANKCGLSDKDVNSWIIDDAVEADNYKDNTDYSITRSMVKLIRCNNLLPIPTSDNIITNFIHKDCYEELVEMLGKDHVINFSL